MKLMRSWRVFSDERAQRVVELIHDLSELEAIENAQDLAAARAALSEPGENVPLDELAKELGV